MAAVAAAPLPTGWVRLPTGSTCTVLSQADAGNRRRTPGLCFGPPSARCAACLPERTCTAVDRSAHLARLEARSAASQLLAQSRSEGRSAQNCLRGHLEGIRAGAQPGIRGWVHHAESSWVDRAEVRRLKVLAAGNHMGGRPAENRPAEKWLEVCSAGNLLEVRAAGHCRSPQSRRMLVAYCAGYLQLHVLHHFAKREVQQTTLQSYQPHCVD